MTVLVGATAYNSHVQNMARALHEAGALAEYVTGGVDSFRSPVSRAVRTMIVGRVPGVDRQLARRRVAGLPEQLVRARWRWEMPRVAASRLGAIRIEDWLWQRGEWSLDRYCAARMADAGIGAFLGIEYGAFASLRAARREGKPGILAFLSPHHRTRARWVDGEYAKFPELRAGRHAGLDALTPGRDQRRDDEAREADWIVTNSSFTTASLVDAGIDEAKILTVPLGGPDPIDARELPSAPSAHLRCLYVGTASVHKGVHYLFHAWRRVASPGMTLDLFGRVVMPDACVSAARHAPGGESIAFHGSVPAADLGAAYRHADVLVLPTLCDGFGQVVAEAMAHGLPVITTHNAGAADAIVHGESGFVIPPADEDALAETLQWCADHPRDLWRMRRSALAAAGHRTWADFRTSFRRALAPVLDAAHPPQAAFDVA